MAAYIKKGDLYVSAEFVSLLKVANVCVEFAQSSSDKTAAPSVATKQVILSADQMKVIFAPGEADNQIFRPQTQNAAILKWPPSVRLLPDTCSRLACTSPHELSFRCQYEQKTGDDDEKALTMNHVALSRGRRWRIFEQIVCRVCGNNLLMSTCGPVTTRVPISSLGLPPGLSWENISMSYFCHEHDHGEMDDEAGVEPAEGRQTQTIFGPQVTEYFDSDTHVVFNNDVLDQDRMTVCKSSGIVNCSRCHKRIGMSVVHADATINDRYRPLVKLYSDVVGCAVDDSLCDELFILAEILNSSDVACRRLCFVDEDHDYVNMSGSTEQRKADVALLITVMDRNLKTMKKAFSFSESVGTMKTVWKLLYRVDGDAGHSQVVQQWLADPKVRLVKVHRELLDKFGVALARNTRELPMAWRYADEFCVSYVPRFD